MRVVLHNKTRLTVSKPVLVMGITLSLSIMYQIYFRGFIEGEIVGGGMERLLLKIIALTTIMFSLRKYVSLKSFQINIVYKIPLLFISLTIAVIIPFLPASYLQAVNMFFFIPLLFINWNKPGGTELYRLIWIIIALTVIIQLILDPVFKSYYQVYWNNRAVIGGMGNPNVFGVFLVASGIVSAFFFPLKYRIVSPFLFVSTALTGSLVSSLVGFGCFFLQLIIYFFYELPHLMIMLEKLRFRVRSANNLIVFSVIAILLAFIFRIGSTIGDISIGHVTNKFIAFQFFLDGNLDPGTSSITIRLDYLYHGLKLLSENPLGLLFGHPNFIPMYNGDGLWISYIVTYGVPVTLSFLSVNLLLCYRGMRSKKPEYVVSALMIVIMMLYFLTNRILDYWPAALIYMLAFSFLAIKDVNPRSRAQQTSARTL